MKKTWTLAALAVLSCAPAAAAWADPEAPQPEPPATANPMGGTAQPGNLGSAPQTGGPKASSNADAEPAQRPGPPDFPENNELPDHGGAELPPRETPPVAARQPAPQAGQPAQPQPAAQTAPPAQPVPQAQPAQQAPQPQPAAQQPQQSLIPPRLPGVGDIGALVSQVLGALPAGK